MARPSLLSPVRSCLAVAAAFSGAALLGLPVSSLAAEPPMEPNASQYGTLGLGQILSAEAMGQQRLTINVRGNLFQQAKSYGLAPEFGGAPPKNAQVTTGIGAVAFGFNPYFDGFLNLAVFNISAANSAPGVNGAGLGTVSGGVQASIPFSKSIPARVGAQLAINAGSAKKQIDTNYADGYNYFETRKGLDFVLRLTQSLLLNGNVMSLRLHLNEGIATSLETDKDALLLQGAAIELCPAPSFILGLEFNSRTFLKQSSDSDPFWVTPSMVFRSQNHLNAQLGVDLSLSQERKTQPRAGVDTRALEPWRIWGALTFSIDLSAPKFDADKARRDSLERLRLTEDARRAQALADSLARKAREDSLANASQRDRERMRADSLARKAREDSLALADARRRLEEERAHRSDWEKEFLRTGVLNLEALYFETGKAVISINSKPYLNIVGKVLTKYPKLQMEVAGHTDNVGGAAANLRLSQDRADAVRLYLTANFPELNGRMTANGYGSTVPKESNRTAEGRQINRRVEVKVLNREVLKEYE
jgi:outer membrane protein OmpA-like peptidoglycan-associated protein